MTLALVLSLALFACRHHEKDDDSKKEGAHATVVEDKRKAAEETIHAYETAFRPDGGT